MCMSDIIQINESILEEIRTLSACAATYEEMAIYLQLPKQLFIDAAKEKNSQVWDAIQSGKLKSEIDIISKLQANAASGNITAAQQFVKMRDQKEVENLKARIFYGED